MILDTSKITGLSPKNTKLVLISLTCVWITCGVFLLSLASEQKKASEEARFDYKNTDNFKEYLKMNDEYLAKTRSAGVDQGLGWILLLLGGVFMALTIDY